MSAGPVGFDEGSVGVLVASAAEAKKAPRKDQIEGVGGRCNGIRAPPEAEWEP